MTRIIIYFLFSIWLCFENVSIKAQNNIDSIQSVLLKAREDSNKVNILNEFSRNIQSKGDYTKAMQYADDALSLSQKINYKKGAAAAYINIGLDFESIGKYPEALKNYLASLKISEKIGDEYGIANSYNNIGTIYDYQGNYSEGLKNYLTSLKISQKIGDETGIASSYENIGIIYAQQGNFKESLKNYFLALKIQKKLGNKIEMAMSYGNIGISYKSEMNYPKALKSYFQALQIQEEIGEKYGIAGTYINLGGVYTNTENFKEALKCLNKALELGKEINAKDILQEAYSGLAETSIKMNDFKKAYEFFKLFAETKDSLFNEESSKQFAEMQTKYETEKKDNEIKLLNKEKEKQAALAAEESRRQKTIILSVSFGLVLVFVFSLFIYRSYRQKQKANLIITDQKIEVEKSKLVIEEKNKIVEEKNKDITDSINYAKKIQEAILPSKELKYKLFPDAFVLFQPKAIVSGDFYWFAEKNGKKLIAAVDCTGHGVPGAFMSMIGNAFLNEIINEKGNTIPSEILSSLSEQIIFSLKQTGAEGESKDGMDIALLSIDTENAIIEFAGANNPLWYIRNGIMEKIKGDKQPIGYYKGEQKLFTNHKIEFKKGDSFYIFSDGFVDQFGGKKEKKFKHKQLENILLSIQDKEMLEQEKIILNTFNNWKGDLEQVDDILIIGIRT